MTRFRQIAAAALCLVLVSASVVIAATSIRRRNVTQRQQQEWTASESIQVYHNDESYDVEARIVGGEEAYEGEFPWFASSSGDVLCGASLIHKQFLLSAAHCYEAFLPGSTVNIGAYERGSSKGTRTVAGVVLHPDFDIQNMANDYMLILLDSPVETITPIELNTDDAVPADGDTVKSMGFGYTSESGLPSLTLQNVDLTVTSHLSCAMSYLLVNRITEANMLCAGGANDAGEDSCSGDSGGPLISAEGKQVGIVSYGLGCARPKTPGVYARVSGGMDFINEGICSFATVDRPESCPEQDDVPATLPIDDTTTDPEPTVPVTTPQDDTSTGTVPGIPLGGTSTIEFLVQYDGYASETTWEISQTGLGVLYTFPDDSLTPENIGDNELWSYVFDEFPAGEYTFTINDSNADGLSGSSENPQKGFFIINNVVDDCNKDILAVGDHDFLSSKSATFTVTSSSSSSVSDGLISPFSALTKKTTHIKHHTAFEKLPALP